MTKLKKYSLEGKEVGEVEVSEALATAEANGQMIKDYIVAIRANARQWSASTKTRSEVKHTTKKPHKQKGTGRARQGSLVSPQFRGGGIVFGPKPKFDQHVRINKKERRSAIRSLIADKIRAGKVVIVDDIAMKEPKTKVLSNFMKGCEIQGRSLFVSEGKTQEVETDGVKKTISVKCSGHENFARSLRNLPKTGFSLAKNMNGYDVMCAQNLILTEGALHEIENWLKVGVKS